MEYLSVFQTSKLMGVCRATINNYCVSGKLKCIKMNRKIFIRRKDIDELFTSAPKYEVTPRASNPEKATKQSNDPNLSMNAVRTEFITAKEAALRFGVEVSSIHSRCRRHSVPWIIFKGTRIYSAPFLDELYKTEEVDSSITEWYSADEIVEKYQMSRTSVYSTVSDHNVPKKKNGVITLYSKTHVDKVLKAREGDTSITSAYTAEDAYDKYGIDPKYVRNFVYRNKIPRRKIDKKTHYSQPHFDEAILRENSPFIYLLIDDAAKEFDKTPKQIYYLIDKYEIPTMNDGTLLRAQKVALNNIINPKNLYDKWQQK